MTAVALALQVAFGASQQHEMGPRQLRRAGQKGSSPGSLRQPYPSSPSSSPSYFHSLFHPLPLPISPSPFHLHSLLHPSSLFPSPVYHHSLPATILISSPFPSHPIHVPIPSPSPSQLRHPLTELFAPWTRVTASSNPIHSIVVSFGSVLQCRCCSPVPSIQPSWVLLPPVLGSPP